MVLTHCSCILDWMRVSFHYGIQLFRNGFSYALIYEQLYSNLKSVDDRNEKLSRENR